ncbi:hypothetical protein ACIBEJ_48790 [Nonomuraea sp. NPDC050790]|uniref:hypothetical protein n=1 Tax=Nonomuraea sp. NPDC050790 TaxID=3364371 RepID=UPI0037BC1DF7
MTESSTRHPWDELIDAGYGWTDQLVSQWDGQTVFVTRNISSPEEQNEQMRIVLPDGSKLYLACFGSDPVIRAFDAKQVEHPFQLPPTDAMRIFGQWIKSLYDQATLKEIDTDL